uniref:Carboxylic ester hydrolase n=1 Tax=Cnaphalocrocis medinalis TaxID=437488 RepID=A0A1U9X1T2_CNAME|nr:carboxylesterase [Cnaphalocrocis medinalis]
MDIMAFVEVSQGPLRGARSITDGGLEYNQFLGIPYAKPPVGNLRFQSPQSPEPWENVRDATQFDQNNISCQLNILTGGTTGSEDCLYLNVYTPEVTPEITLRPVMVFIHGGGFIGGNGTLKSENGPDYLLENGMVVVTINYRLGILGFLSLDIPEAAGNMGLKDQVKALEWIRDNISGFGGDKNNVTIMGLSAGSASVDYLMLSPLAKGLFHKAILQSGSTLNHWAINLKTEDFTQQFVTELGYKGSFDDKHAIYELLLKTPADKLVSLSYLVTEKYTSDRLSFGFVPTVEKDFGNGDAFLTTSPFKLLKEGRFNKVPAIRGFCNKEGALTCWMKAHILNKLKEKKDFANVWPCQLNSESKNKYNLKFSTIYFDCEKVDEVWEDFFGDIDFAAGISIAGKISSRYAPVYMYKFSYVGDINYCRNMAAIIPNLTPIPINGAMHGDDNTYVWKIDADAYKNPNEQDILVRKRMVKMFSDFAKTGEPVRSTTNLIQTTWEPYKESSPVYLGIDKELSILEDYEPKKIAIFEELYENHFP